MAREELSPQMQNQLAQFQQLQQQIQAVAAQRIQYEAKLREIENTIEELERTNEGATIYKSIGTLLIRADDQKKIREELDEHRETMNIRIKALQRQEESLTQRFKEIQKKLSAALGEGGN